MYHAIMYDSMCTLSMQNPSQKVVQKLAAEVWNRLPQATKSTEQEWENYVSEIETSELARGILC